MKTKKKKSHDKSKNIDSNRNKTNVTAGNKMINVVKSNLILIKTK